MTIKSVCMNCEGGSIRIFASDKGVTQLDLLHAYEASETTDHPILLQALAEMHEYFAGDRKVFTVPLDVQVGTPFQNETWESLKRIPYGETISYGEQAKSIGRPKAFRAVGAANGKNPIAVIIPCHRVVNSQGKLHGFAGGLEMKRFLLAVEGLDVNA